MTIAGWALDPEATIGSGIDAVQVWARPTGPGASNLLGTVVRANGLAVVPPGEPTVRAGERVTVRFLGQPPS